MEQQAKVVNDVSTAFLECFKAHVHDLEDALVDLAKKPTKEGELESALHQARTQLKEAEDALATSQASCSAMKRDIDKHKAEDDEENRNARKIDADLCKARTQLK